MAKARVRADEFDGVLVVLDKPRRMIFDFAAIKVFKRETGKTLLKQILLSELDEEELQTLIWVGLLRNDPTLERDTVGTIVTMQNLARVWEALAVAFGGAMPDSQEDSGDGPLAEARPSS